MKVILAIDDSIHSWEAVEAVAAGLWPSDTIVQVLSAVEVLVPASPEMWSDAAAVFEHAQQEMIQNAELITTRAANFLSVRGLTAKAIVREGSARQVIVEQAKDWNADLIVVGSHVDAGLKRWLLGSVAEYVVSHAPCSVEVIRKREPEDRIELATAA